jgi:DNA repair protein RadC
MPKTSDGGAQRDLPWSCETVLGARAGPAPNGFSYREIMDAFAKYIVEERPRLETPGDVAALMRPVLSGKEQEEFHVLLVDTKHRLLRSEKVTVGLLDRAQIHPREVFRPAIREACSCIVLVHNHPSGDPTPSTADIASTKDLVSAGKIIGIHVIDHVIIGQRSATNPKGYLSFREEGQM